MGIWFLKTFLIYFAFWFPLHPTNMSIEPKHAWLVEDFSKNIFIKVLTKHLQLVGNGSPL